MGLNSKMAPSTYRLGREEASTVSGSTRGARTWKHDVGAREAKSARVSWGVTCSPRDSSEQWYLGLTHKFPEQILLSTQQ